MCATCTEVLITLWRRLRVYDGAVLLGGPWAVLVPTCGYRCTSSLSPSEAWHWSPSWDGFVNGSRERSLRLASSRVPLGERAIDLHPGANHVGAACARGQRQRRRPSAQMAGALNLLSSRAPHCSGLYAPGRDQPFGFRLDCAELLSTGGLRQLLAKGRQRLGDC